VALSKTQQEILDVFKIPLDLQQWIAMEFNEAGEPKGLGHPDFLMVLSDLLYAADTYLGSQRAKLAQFQNPIQDTKASPQEWQAAISNLEETVKEAWLSAIAFWRVITHVMQDPPYYQVIILRNHIEYAFQKKNLTLIQMLQSARPEFFALPSSPIFIKLIASLAGFIAGLLFGLLGGIMGAACSVKTKHYVLRPLLALGSALWAIIPGMVGGSIVGSTVSFETGNIIIGTKMAYYARRINPFGNQPGSKQQQAVDLKKQLLIFKLSGISR
jgi:hypothetical protein